MSFIFPLRRALCARRGKLWPFVLSCLFLLLSSLGFGQDTFKPLWSEAKLAGLPVFSPDGKCVIESSDTSLKIWRVSDGALMGIISRGIYAAPAFFSDSQTIVVPTRDAISRYRFPSMAYIDTIATVGPSVSIKFATGSLDGRYIVYTVNSWPPRIHVYDTTRRAETAEWEVPAGSMGKPAITRDNKKIVTDGPTVYSLRGQVLAGKTDYGHEAVVSADGSRIYQYLESTRKVTAFTMESLASVWATSVRAFGLVPYNQDWYRVSTDGKALCFPARSGEDPGVFSLNTADGSLLAGSISPLGARYMILGLSPVDNAIWCTYPFSRELSPLGGSAYLLANLNTGTGEIIPQRPTVIVQDADTWAMFTSATSPSNGPLLLIESMGAKPVLRRLSDGAFLRFIQVQKTTNLGMQQQVVGLSQDGKYAAAIGKATLGGVERSGLIVCRTDNGQPIAYVPNPANVPGGYINFQWVGSSRLAVRDSSASPHIDSYDFDGSRLTFVSSVPCESHGLKLAVSSDGKRAVTLGDRLLRLTDMDSGGFSAVTLNSYSTESTDIRFVDGTYRFSVSYFMPKPEGEVQVVDLYDGVGGKSVLVRHFEAPGYVMSLPSSNGAVSPDGRWVKMNYRTSDMNDASGASLFVIYRVSDGKVVRTYRDQFDGGGHLAFAFSADSLSYVYYTPEGNLIRMGMPVAVTGFTVDPDSAVGGTAAKGTIALDAVAPSDTEIALASDQKAVALPASVTVPAGKSSVEFSIPTRAVDVGVLAKLTATLGTDTLSARLQVTAPTKISLAFKPRIVESGQGSTGTVTLNGPAGPAGVKVSLTSGATSVKVPGSVRVKPGETAASFDIATIPSVAVVKASIAAKAGPLAETATLTVNPTIKPVFTLAPASARGGSMLTLLVELSEPAPAGGIAFALMGDSPEIVPPAKLTVPAGATEVSVAVRTKPVVAKGRFGLTVSSGDYRRSLSVVLVPPAVASVAAAPVTVVSGGSFRLTVTLDGSVAAGFKVPATSSSTLVAVPARIAFSAGKSTVQVTLKSAAFTGKSDRTVRITVGGKSVVVTLKPKN